MKPWLFPILFIALCGFSPAHAEAPQRSPKPAQAAIASANAYATDAGLEVLAMGGNAFDAAVAVSATLGLVEPESSGLGGGGFMLLHTVKDGRDIFIDARERAPMAASRDMYIDANGAANRELSLTGALAAAIPGLPAGLVHLSKKYGRLPLAKSLAPTIRLARKGWRFGRKNAAMLEIRAAAVAADPGASALFMRGGKPVKIGDVLRNPDYARVLEGLARDAGEDFYRGELAKRLVAGVRAKGGIWTAQDLADYRVIERQPLRVKHRGFEIITAPLPSSGGVALTTILNILSGYDYLAMPAVARTHVIVEAMRRASRDRAAYLGDPDFVDVPVSQLTSLDYAAGLRAGIHPDSATPSVLLPGINAPSARSDTSHFSIIDADGNLAAVTQTVNIYYGNAVVIPGSGFLLNDEMDDFSVQPGVPNAFGLVGNEANAIAPGKRPLSSMAPTFLRSPERIAVLGTPGGSRITSMVLLSLLALMDGQSAEAAVALPRFHHQYLPDILYAEPDAFTPQQQATLAKRGFTLEVGGTIWGNMNLVLWKRDTGAVETGTDPRWKGIGKGAEAASIYR